VEHAPQADHIRLLFDPQVAVATCTGQRRRFASVVEGLSTEELAWPSRCEDWTVGDVLRHLLWVDLTVRRIWSGDESIADGFDPRITPNKAVRKDRSVPDDEVRERYLLSSKAMVADLESSDSERFGQPSLSPAGHVPWWMSAVHIGWDSSIHERDALLPLGLRVEQLNNETDLYLAYSLVLTSFFAGRDPIAVRIGPAELRRDNGPVIVRMVSSAEVEDESRFESPTVVTTEDPVKAIDAISGRGDAGDALRGEATFVHRLGGLSRFFSAGPLG